MWIVFIYRCLGNFPNLLLFKKGREFQPMILKDIGRGGFGSAARLFTSMTDIKRKDCFPERFFESAHSFYALIGKEKVDVWTTSIRILDNCDVSFLKNSNRQKWFLKEEVANKLRINKIFTKAFNEEFGKSEFWECLDTKR
jgi:hypothetical protein